MADTTEIDGVRRRASKRARRLSLKVDAAAGVVELVVPDGAPESEVTRFVDSHRRWIARQLESLPPHIPFADGVEISVLDDALRLRHCDGAGVAPQREGDDLVIGGDPARFAARARAWLRESARSAFYEHAHGHAAHIGQRVTGIRIGDPRTRWGSCSRKGNLAFSWRLVLAPRSVLDYVAAHEVAHLAEMNHSRRFWRLVDDLHPDVATARAWLTAHGPNLHRYG
ncbi:MAG: SprT family zinc-dependent metalloprotease [Alphaproteobacteria bacterium]|jgi:hypothetical protein|nr:SprT family zinc-dependent metalloprotease [Alphaproteobacteria bacterium]